MGNKKDLDNNRNKCYGRCRTWFSLNQSELINPCKDACYNRHELTRDEFLCSGNYMNDLDFMLAYGYDPCPNSGFTFAQYEEIKRQRTQTPPALPPPAGNGYPGDSTGGMDDDYEDDPNSGGTVANNSDSKNTWLWIGGGVLLSLLLLFLFMKK